MVIRVIVVLKFLMRSRPRKLKRNLVCLTLFKNFFWGSKPVHTSFTSLFTPFNIGNSKPNIASKIVPKIMIVGFSCPKPSESVKGWNEGSASCKIQKLETCTSRVNILV